MLKLQGTGYRGCKNPEKHLSCPLRWRHFWPLREVGLTKSSFQTDGRGMTTFDLSFRPRMLHIGHRRTASAHMSTDVSNGNDLVKNSSLYKEFQAELNEILRHKWIESEKAGRDIGFEQALTDWIMKHRSKWRKARQTPR